ncbi:MAG: hypothetical protein HYR55_02890 [Acidobacteria bacterium]|nr:hypothetical protein [Acidobacteriota bacterium]
MRKSLRISVASVSVMLLALAMISVVGGADCKGTSVGLVPLTDMGADVYKGFPGGLYADGRNVRPATHERAGRRLAEQVIPIDADGNPDPQNGKIVLLSIGMSNTTQEYSAFIQLADRSPGVNPQLVIVDGAQGGMTASIIMNPEDGGPGTRYWTVVDERLSQAGVSPQQVQATWIKEADAQPREGFPEHASTLQRELTVISQVLKNRFPNIKLAYLSSRTYGGYASTPLNPEPYAYQSGFSVKWMIEDQINGNPELNYDPNRGPVRSPWLSWGAYLWADGLNPRSDGLVWECEDFIDTDGTHPSLQGRRKVAEMLLDFFKNDSTTVPWFLGP